VKTAEAFSGVAIAGSLILLLYLVIARGGEGWQVAAALFVAALCWKWWARLMKWLHHD
jgi:hypothetical protein